MSEIPLTTTYLCQSWDCCQPLTGTIVSTSYLWLNMLNKMSLLNYKHKTIYSERLSSPLFEITTSHFSCLITSRNIFVTLLLIYKIVSKNVKMQRLINVLIHLCKDFKWEEKNRFHLQLKRSSYSDCFRILCCSV